jgi:hypothetical protein
MMLSVGSRGNAGQATGKGFEWKLGRNALVNMDLNVRLDEQDLERAKRISGITDPAAVVQHALREFVRLQVAAELIRLGGSDPSARCPPVRRPPDFVNRPRDLEPPG